MTTRTKTKHRSAIVAMVHETVRDMHELGLVDKKTMRDFDLRCLTPVEDLSPKEIVTLRQQAEVSQAVLARALNVTTNYVSKLESGAKRPSGSTLKLLLLMKRKGFDAIL